MGETKKEYWLHVRQSLGTSGGKLNIFEELADDGRTRTGIEHAYKLKYSGLAIAGVYLVDVERTDKNILIQQSKLEFLGPFYDNEVYNQLNIEHKLFKEQERQKRHEKKYKDFELPQTINGLADHYRKLEYNSDLRLFEDIIIDEIRKRARAMGCK